MDTCNPLTRSCDHVRSCDDFFDCTADECIGDQCVNTPNSSLCNDGDGCTDDVCAVGEGCIGNDNDAPCDDGRFCTVNDSCLNGECGGAVRDCSDGVECTVDTCVEEADVCAHSADHAACDNGVFCDGGEICNGQAGCGEGPDIDCSGLTGPCAVGQCDEGSNTCTADPRNEGVGCDDGQACTTSDSCRSGQCTGDAKNCSDGVDCTIDVCTEPSGDCANTVDHSFCDDGSFCNGDELCDASGGCQLGGGRDCTSLDTFCSLGICDDISDACFSSARNTGMPCEDDNSCTENEMCALGVCSGDVIFGCGQCGDSTVEGDEECDDGGRSVPVRPGV